MAESVVVTSENQQNYIYLGQSKPAGRFALGSRYSLLDIGKLRVFLDVFRKVFDRKLEGIDDASFRQLDGIEDVGEVITPKQVARAAFIDF